MAEIAEDPTEIDNRGNFHAAFTRGLILGVAVYALVGGWLFLSADKTAALRQSLIPSKTVTVQWPHTAAEDTAVAEDIGE
ncbi:MAG TPA: hypothetical protein VIG74_06255, partial [Alphaproteobacteria bacterium]